MYFCAIIMKNTTMWKENLYQQVEILLREHDEFPIGEHQHSFFEMTYILEGSGDFCAHTMGSEREWHTYEAGDLFLVPPNRIHLYTIRTHSRYVFIRFTENYVLDCIGRYIGHALDIQSGFRMDFRRTIRKPFVSWWDCWSGRFHTSVPYRRCCGPIM